MRPNPVPTPADGESALFRNRLDNLIDMRHEFVRLSGLIDWRHFDEAFGTLYAEKGRLGLPTRLMVELHLIKHTRALSDELCPVGGERLLPVFHRRDLFSDRAAARPDSRCRCGAAASAPRSSRR
jgi:hypothetical protein